MSAGNELALNASPAKERRMSLVDDGLVQACASKRSMAASPVAHVKKKQGGAKEAAKQAENAKNKMQQIEQLRKDKEEAIRARKEAAKSIEQERVQMREQLEKVKKEMHQAVQLQQRAEKSMAAQAQQSKDGGGKKGQGKLSQDKDLKQELFLLTADFKAAKAEISQLTQKLASAAPAPAVTATNRQLPADNDSTVKKMRAEQSQFEEQLKHAIKEKADEATLQKQAESDLQEQHSIDLENSETSTKHQDQDSQGQQQTICELKKELLLLRAELKRSVSEKIEDGLQRMQVDRATHDETARLQATINDEIELRKAAQKALLEQCAKPAEADQLKQAIERAESSMKKQKETAERSIQQEKEKVKAHLEKIKHEMQQASELHKQDVKEAADRQVKMTTALHKLSKARDETLEQSQKDQCYSDAQVSKLTKQVASLQSELQGRDAEDHNDSTKEVLQQQQLSDARKEIKNLKLKEVHAAEQSQAQISQLQTKLRNACVAKETIRSDLNSMKIESEKAKKDADDLRLRMRNLERAAHHVSTESSMDRPRLRSPSQASSVGRPESASRSRSSRTREESPQREKSAVPVRAETLSMKDLLEVPQVRSSATC
jgi:DNA repair exonuclease SbcCD ATPase subunit